MKIAHMVVVAAVVTVNTLASLDAFAGGNQTCGGQVVPRSVRTCPDGSLPIYQAEIIQPTQPAHPGAATATAGSLLGVWHTNVTGGVWQSPSAVPGYDLLHISPGVKAGDLTLDSSGRFVWNSYGGKVGQWQETGDPSWPILLIDTAEGRRWKVGPNQRRTGEIFIWDGTFTYAGKR